MKIGIIGGSGKMGQWLARWLLKEEFEVILSDKNKTALQEMQENLKVGIAGSAGVMQEADIIILAVNIDSFEEVVKEIAPHVRPGQVILDITSVKEAPVNFMHQYLQSGTVLGTHPLFGPGAQDLSNQNIVLTPTNEREDILAYKVRTYLQEHGSRVTLMTPRKHDEMMAVVLGLAHFIAIVAADTIAEVGKIPDFKAIGGSTYRVLNTMVESVVSEDPALYAALQMELPYITEVESLFQMKAAKWAEIVQNKDRAGFIKNMTSLKYKFARDSDNFGQAYENMYKIMKWL